MLPSRRGIFDARTGNGLASLAIVHMDILVDFNLCKLYI